MDTTTTSTQQQAELPPQHREHDQLLTAGIVGLVLGIILTSIVFGAVVLAGADSEKSDGIFSPERSRTQVPAWMHETPEIFSPERSRTQVPAWMRETPEIVSPERSRTEVATPTR